VLARALRAVRDGLVSISYPEQCDICGSAVESWDDGSVCAGCWLNPAITRIFSGALCPKCGASAMMPFGGAASALPSGAYGCNGCAGLPLAGLRSTGVYSGALKSSILFLKSRPHICTRLRQLVAETFSNNRAALECDVVMPAPLHRSRQRERGFNQAAIIASVLGSRFALPVDGRSLVRERATERHRAGLDAMDRVRSVERAFRVARPGQIKGVSILLVDDVYTTGSTISAAARTLLDAGAREVKALTIARVLVRGNEQVSIRGAAGS